MVNLLGIIRIIKTPKPLNLAKMCKWKVTQPNSTFLLGLGSHGSKPEL